MLAYLAGFATGCAFTAFAGLCLWVWAIFTGRKDEA